jgi:monoamine oxidase
MVMPAFTRRTFLAGAGAVVASGASPGGCFAADACAEYDVVVVGAGIAGMAAAAVLQMAGRRVVVVEAMDRVGGRCVSDNTTFPGVVFDRGAQWFHQVLSYNPLYEVARTSGAGPVEDTGPRQAWDGTHYDAAATATVEQDSAKLEGALEPAAQGVLLGRSDVSAQHAVASAGIADLPLMQLAEALIGTLTAGANFDAISASDLENFTERPSGDDYLLRSGMGNFIARFAKGLRIELNTPVRAIRYGGRNGVLVETSRGTVCARRAIVTVSTGVLAAEAIRFAPALPSQYVAAIDALPMGVFEKVALGFDRDIFGDVAPNTNIFPAQNSEDVPALIAKLWGSNVAVCYFGGRKGIAVEQGGVAAMKAYALETVRTSFSGATEYRAASVEPWKINPWTRGSYSYARPGGAPARRFLATPLGGEQLYFAGEALSVHSYGTLSAAYQSGTATAKAILRVPSTVS